MPLNCDCYGGCWGDHSEDWPSTPDESESMRKLAVLTLPYGTYVTVDGYLRVETQELLNQLKIQRGITS